MTQTWMVKMWARIPLKGVCKFCRNFAKLCGAPGFWGMCSIITARKRSLRRLCFYRCLSVHRGGACVSHGTTPPATMHAPLAATHTPGSHACPPAATHAPQQPCIPSSHTPPSSHPRPPAATHALLAATHAPWQWHTPPSSHACPPWQPCTPPQQPRMPPGNHACPPGNHACPPRYRKSTFSLQKHIFTSFLNIYID